MATRMLRISNKSGVLSVFWEIDAQRITEVRFLFVRLIWWAAAAAENGLYRRRASLSSKAPAAPGAVIPSADGGRRAAVIAAASAQADFIKPGSLY